MQTILSLILILSFISIIIGWISPSFFARLFKKALSKKQIIWTSVAIFFFTAYISGTYFPTEQTKINFPTAQSSTASSTISTLNTKISDQNVPTATSSSVPESRPELTNDRVVAQVVTAKPTNTTSKPSAITSAAKYYAVTSVVDGDTIKVNINGKAETLRLIGIDTPETVDPRKPVQCFGLEASNRAKQLLLNKRVRLEPDPTQGERDKYDRLLFYVYREDGLFFNKNMIEDGYAYEYTYNIPYKYQTEFKVAQKYAMENQKGLWSTTACNGKRTASSSTEVPITTTTTQNSPAIQTSGKYFTSSFYSSKYYYPETCEEWKNLSSKYLRTFESLEALFKAYPTRTLSPQCQQ